MDENLEQIRVKFKQNMKQTNSFPFDISDSPLTISCNNSDDEIVEEKHFKALSVEEIEQSLDKYYDDNGYYVCVFTEQDEEKFNLLYNENM